MSEDRVLKWAWVYGHPNVEPFDTLEEAFASAFIAEEYGQEVLSHFEIVGEGVVTRTDPRWEVFHRRQTNEREPLIRTKYKVEIESLLHQPESKWSSRMVKHWGGFEWFVDEAEAQECVAEWAEKLGADRVRLVEL